VFTIKQHTFVNLMFVDPCIIVQIIQITNKMQLFTRIYYSSVYQ